MHNTLFVHASPHGKHALGYRLAQKILAEETARNSNVGLIERDLAITPRRYSATISAIVLTPPCQSPSN